jgi:hypothetical protein
MKYEAATCFNSFNINLFYLIIWSSPRLGDSDNLAPKLGKVAHARLRCYLRWVFQKELYNGVPNVTVRPVLRKCLDLMAYKVSIVQHL